MYRFSSESPPVPPFQAMMRSFILACAFAGVASDALELTSANWDAEVVESGKVSSQLCV